MPKNNYFFAYYTPDGNLKFFLTAYHSANFWVEEGSVGSFTIDLPYKVAETVYPQVQEDGIFEIYRSGKSNNELMFGKRWFLKMKRIKQDERGVKYLRLISFDCNHLFNKRVIAYSAGKKRYVNKEGYADDLIKAFARENFGALCTDATRDWSDKITIENDLSLGPEIEVEAGEYKLLNTVFQEISDLAYEEDETYLTYNMSWSPEASKYRFRTHIGCLGTNRGMYSKDPIYLTTVDSNARGSRGGLAYASVEYDARDTRTRIYCGGRGSGEEQTVVEAEATTRIERVPFGLWEDFEHAGNAEKTAVITKIANQRLREWRPYIKVNGHMEKAFTDYLGDVFDWGDILAIKYHDEIYDIHINKVMIDLPENGSQDIRIFTRNMEEEFY